jgi:hypothetical protein
MERIRKSLIVNRPGKGEDDEKTGWWCRCIVNESS